METKVNLTYKQALENGYKELDEKYQRKYVSRKINIDDQPVLQVAGTAHRAGSYYVEIPSFRSSTYSIRRYLQAPESN